MFKVYSKGCEHALRVLTQIPIKEYDQKFLAKDLIEKAKVPETPTRKSLQILVKAKILDAISGPGGGYRLSQHPKNISLLSVIKAIDGEESFNKCIMGFSECSTTHPCPVHDTWKRVKKDMLTELGKKNLAQLIKLTTRRKK